MFTAEELTNKISGPLPRSPGILGVVRPIGDVGLGQLPLIAAPRFSEAEHREFLAKTGLVEAGDPLTATRRSRVLAEALSEAPEMINPALNSR